MSFAEQAFAGPHGGNRSSRDATLATLAHREIPDSVRQKMHDTYRHLHSHPELSMHEHRTADFISEKLSQIGIESFSCGGTGVVGILRNGPGPVVAYRADIDGLPLREETGLPYASTATASLEDGTSVPVMHGCGHDAHVAVALAVAEIMAAQLDLWSGTVVWIFQPGEETSAGARAMLTDGLWDRAPKPEIVLGQHVGPEEAGTVSVTSGPAMAMADALKVTVLGRGAHGSQPQDSIDPIVLGAHMITRIQTIVSRELHPMAAAVVTIATFHGGLKENIIPDSAEFTVNVRSFDRAVRANINRALRRVISAEAAASGAPEPIVEELYTFPLNYNDPHETEEARSALRAVLGTEHVHDSEPRMGSEDFGALAEAIGVPSVFWFFGGLHIETINSDLPTPANHSPFFAPAIEPTLTTGVRAAHAVIMSKVAGGRTADHL